MNSIDTNVLVYATDETASAKHASARRLLERAFSFPWEKVGKGVSVNCFGVSRLHAQLPPHPAQSGVYGVVKQMTLTPLIPALILPLIL